MPLEHDGARAKRVRDQTIGSSVNVSALDLEDPVGMLEIPHLATAPRLESGEHQLCAHGAVTHQRTRASGFVKKRNLHGEIDPMV
jgi:hypothetical protein